MGSPGDPTLPDGLLSGGNDWCNALDQGHTSYAHSICLCAKPVGYEISKGGVEDAISVINVQLLVFIINIQAGIHRCQSRVL